jgi:hypothetical protein
MVTAADFKVGLPPTCSVNIPKEGDTLDNYLSYRWMGLGPSKLPAATLTPSTEDDVAAAVRFAGHHGLRVIPKCGGMGGLVVLNERALYLDMIRFNDVRVDTSARTVTVGGGVLTGKLMKVVLDAGYYTGRSTFLVSLQLTNTIEKEKKKKTGRRKCIACCGEKLEADARLPPQDGPTTATSAWWETCCSAG